MADGQFEKTIYTGCFEASTGMYYYNTYDDPTIYCVSPADADGADGLVTPEPTRSTRVLLERRLRSAQLKT